LVRGTQTSGRTARKTRGSGNLPLNSGFHGSLNAAAIQSVLGTTATTVGAIVTQDDPTETITDEARYTLTVNGVVQPGG
jgi:hypothetical protein